MTVKESLLKIFEESGGRELSSKLYYAFIKDVIVVAFCFLLSVSVHQYNINKHFCQPYFLFGEKLGHPQPLSDGDKLLHSAQILKKIVTVLHRLKLKNGVKQKIKILGFILIVDIHSHFSFKVGGQGFLNEL